MIECKPNITYDNDNLTLLDSMTCSITRYGAEAAVLCFFYLVLFIFSSVTNIRLIIMAISERCREIDSFTFVFASSLSFNQFFISFFVYPVVFIAMISKAWLIQKLWCWFCALISAYLYTVYALHIVILLLDMIIVKYCNIRTLISVHVSKTIALTTWMVALVPQLYPLVSESKDTRFRYDPVKGGCFQTFVFESVKSVLVCVGIYILLPLVVIAVRYMQLLFHEDDRRNLAATISRRVFDQPIVGVRNYNTAICFSAMAALTSIPWFTLEVIKMTQSTLDDSVGTYRALSEIFSLWMCSSSLLVPIIYLSTCPTYFRQVFPEHQFKLLYKLGLGRIPKKQSCKNNFGDFLQNVINPIQEENESDLMEDDDSEEYIELPAVTIIVNNEDSISRSDSRVAANKKTKSPKTKKKSVGCNGSDVSVSDNGGITYENGHANSTLSTGTNGAATACKAPLINDTLVTATS